MIWELYEGFEHFIKCDQFFVSGNFMGENLSKLYIPGRNFQLFSFQVPTRESISSSSSEEKPTEATEPTVSIPTRIRQDSELPSRYVLKKKKN